MQLHLNWYVWLNTYICTMYTCCIHIVTCNLMSCVIFLKQLHKFVVACFACCSRTMGDRAQDFLAMWTQELFCRLSWSMTTNLGSISARGDFVCMGCLGVCVLAGTWRKMATDRWGYAAPHWWGMEGSDLGEECEEEEA